MVDAAMENATLVRRTVVTAGAMVGVCVAIVGTLTLAAVLVVGHAVGGSSSASTDVAPPPGVARSVPVAGVGTAAALGVQKR